MKYPIGIQNFESFDAMLMPFEDFEVLMPKGYDPYLRKQYGDYMQMPPEDKQVPHHNHLFVDFERRITKEV